MLLPVLRKYEYWIKVDVDIWMFRPFPFNLVDTLAASGAIFAHTGFANNGNGCSRNLHASILNFTDTHKIKIVSEAEKWWKDDDAVFYSNFVISSVAFHTSQWPMELARFLNEDVVDGFFRYRWTDQSLFHKVFGVFTGPKLENFTLDWSEFRWHKKHFRHRAVFYHGKSAPTRRYLAKKTRL